MVTDPHEDVKEYVRTREFTSDTMMALRNMVNDIGTEVANFKELGLIPEDRVRNFRNDMYLVSESLRLLKKSNAAKISASDWVVLDNYKKHVDKATKFIFTWVKVAVALALGLGTMVGWKRIVVTVGEKQRPSDLRPGRGGRDHRDGYDWRGRLHGVASEYHPRVVVRRRWHDVGQQVGLAVVDATQLDDGLGADATGFHRTGGVAVLDVQQFDEQGIIRLAWRAVGGLNAAVNWPATMPL